MEALHDSQSGEVLTVCVGVTFMDISSAEMVCAIEIYYEGLHLRKMHIYLRLCWSRQGVVNQCVEDSSTETSTIFYSMCLRKYYQRVSVRCSCRLFPVIREGDV